uniref:C-type lectin domain-containing protein n=1 Tax=Myotis lucifugus TaxID=59463 RepID=G1Q512_MYOLU
AMLLLLSMVILLTQPPRTWGANVKTLSREHLIDNCTLVTCSPVENGLPGRDGRDGRDSPRGEKEDPGSPGATGRMEMLDVPKGDKSSAGEPGPKGDSGPRGPPGPAGVCGPAGREGPSRIQRDVGPQGKPTPKREPGPKGEVGAQGVQGSAGTRPPGLIGEKGAPGESGDPGFAGAAVTVAVGFLRSSSLPLHQETLSLSTLPLDPNSEPIPDCEGLVFTVPLSPADISALWQQLEALQGQVRRLQGAFLQYKKVELYPNGRDVGQKVFKTAGFVKRFQEAEQMCAQAGGQLPSPRSAAENYALQQLVEAKNSGAAFLSMTDFWMEGRFTYPEGVPLVYSNWAPGEPNDDSGREDCAEIMANGKWNDVPCGAKRLVICEF